jgi:hypothetical protein
LLLVSAMSRLFGPVLLLRPVASIRIVALDSVVVALRWLMLFLGQAVVAQIHKIAGASSGPV